MNRTKFTPCVTIDTSEPLSGEFALPIKYVDRGDKKIHQALFYRDPRQQYLIRKKRGLVLVRLEDLFVDAQTHAPTTEEIYDRATLKRLRNPPSYAGAYFLVQHHYWLRSNKITSCLIGANAFLGSDGKRYIPEVSDLNSVSHVNALQLRARRADNDVRWSTSESWLFEVSV